MMLVVDTKVALFIAVLGHVIFPSVDVFSDVSLAARLWRGIDRNLTVRWEAQITMVFSRPWLAMDCSTNTVIIK